MVPWPFALAITTLNELLRSLAEAQLRHDEKKLGEVIEVLKVERETWRQVCEQVPDSPHAGRGPAAGDQFTSHASSGGTVSATGPKRPVTPPIQSDWAGGDLTGLSLEA